MVRSALGVAAASLLTIAPVGPAGPAPSRARLPAGFSTHKVLGGLDAPTAVAFSPDRKIFVAEKSGVIKVFENLRDGTPKVFANLETNVYNAYDRGLLGLTLHPDFPQTPYVYALYSFDGDVGGSAPKWGGGSYDPCPDPPGRNTRGCVISGRLSRLTADADGDEMVAGSEKTLVHDWCQQFPSHSIGDLAFGPDGMLYASGGDGAAFLFADYGQRGNPCGDPPAGQGERQTPPSAEGGALRAQDLRTADDPASLDGSIIRVDPLTGAAALDNPIVSADENARRIIAHGLRNPFRFAFRPGSHEIYVADTGWERFDELNVVADSSDAVVENFGWPCYEGPHRQPLYETTSLDICTDLYAEAEAVAPPHSSYLHDRYNDGLSGCGSAGGALSGVAFYEGGRYPDRYDGTMFMADYARRCMWVVYPDGTGRPDPDLAHRFALLENIVDLEIGPRGDLFYVDIAGSVKRVTYTSGNNRPRARISASPRYGPVPLEVRFSGRRSGDPDGDDLRYSWDLDSDGRFDDSRRARPARTFHKAGVRKVGLKVRDGRGAADIDVIKVYPGNHPPRIRVDRPAPWRVGDDIELRASVRDPEDGRVRARRIDWSVGIQHCARRGECHLHSLAEADGSRSIRFAAPDHSYPAWLRVRVKARDRDGLTTTKTFRLDPRTTTLTLRSDPPGVRLVGGIDARVAPYSFTAIVRSRIVIAAPLTHEGRSFEAWSDGRARTHSVVARRRDATYRASYQEE